LSRVDALNRSNKKKERKKERKSKKNEAIAATEAHQRCRYGTERKKKV